MRAVREARLAPEQLLEVADAVRDAPAGISPRDLAARIPHASTLIAVASKVGERWVELLVIALMLVVAYMTAVDAERAHNDAQRAHQDAQQADRDAERAHQDSVRQLRDTAELSDEDIRMLADQLDAEFKKARKRLSP